MIIIEEGVSSHGLIEDGTTFGVCTGIEGVTSVGVVQGIEEDVPALGFVGGIEENV